MNTEFGAFVSVNYLKEINKSITYKGRLDLFSNYRGKTKNVDLNMSNFLNAKLTQFLSANYGIDLIYDDDVKQFGPGKNAARLQLKSMVGIGLLAKF